MFYYQLYFTGIIHISKQLLYILLEEIVRSRMLVPLLDGEGPACVWQAYISFLFLMFY